MEIGLLHTSKHTHRYVTINTIIPATEKQWRKYMSQPSVTILKELISEVLNNTNEAARDVAREAAVHMASQLTRAEVDEAMHDISLTLSL